MNAGTQAHVKPETLINGEVADIPLELSPSQIWVPEGTTIRQSFARFLGARKGCILAGELKLGQCRIVSQVDLLRALYVARTHTWDSVIDETLGTSNLISVDLHKSTPSDVLGRICQPFRHLPVTDGDAIVGLLMRREVVRQYMMMVIYNVSPAGSEDIELDTDDEPLPIRDFATAASRIERKIVTPNCTFNQAIRKLVKPDIRQLYVVKDELLLGIMTEHDALYRGHLGDVEADTPIAEIMTPFDELRKLKSDDSMLVAQAKFAAQMSQLPICHEQRFQGELTVYALASAIADAYQPYGCSIQTKQNTSGVCDRNSPGS